MSDGSWLELYRELWPYLLDWLISRYRVSTPEAEDILQEALLQYRDKMLTRQFVRSNLAHIIGFVRYCALSYLRRKSRLVALDDMEPGLSSPDPERELFQKLMVDEALERLDQRCAFAMRAKYFGGLSSSELGAALNMEPGAVDTMLTRCRAECRRILSGLKEQMPQW